MTPLYQCIIESVICPYFYFYHFVYLPYNIENICNNITDNLYWNLFMKMDVVYDVLFAFDFIYIFF